MPHMLRNETKYCIALATTVRGGGKQRTTKLGRRIRAQGAHQPIDVTPSLCRRKKH